MLKIAPSLIMFFATLHAMNPDYLKQDHRFYKMVQYYRDRLIFAVRIGAHKTPGPKFIRITHSFPSHKIVTQVPIFQSYQEAVASFTKSGLGKTIIPDQWIAEKKFFFYIWDETRDGHRPIQTEEDFAAFKNVTQTQLDWEKAIQYTKFFSDSFINNDIIPEQIAKEKATSN